MKPQISIAADVETLVREVAELIWAKAREAIAERGRFTFVLTGGESPVPLYRLLGSDPAYRDFPWKQTLFFFGDERHVPPDSSKSNYRQAADLLGDRVPAGNVFRIQGELADPDEAATHYAQELARVFPGDALPRFDLILLGLGPNGHVASLFPGTAALDENLRWVVGNWVPQEDEHRITMTFPVLNHARSLVMQVIDPKQQGIAALVLSAADNRFPANQLSPKDGDYLWYMTKAAAGHA